MYYAVALDETKRARSAFNFAISLMNKDIDTLCLLNVREPTPVPLLVAIGGFSLDNKPAYQEEERRRMARSRAILQHYHKKAKELGFKAELLSVASTDRVPPENPIGPKKPIGPARFLPIDREFFKSNFDHNSSEKQFLCPKF